MLKKWLRISLWSLVGVTACTLLIAAMQKKESKECTDIKINIEGAKDHKFIDEKDVMEIMKDNGAEKGKEISTIHLRGIEEQLEKNAWINDADLFFDNNEVLHAKIEESEPIARIFTLSGKSFYIDSSCNTMPLSDERSARVPMFTSFPSDKKVLSKPDSLVMQDVKHIAQYINNDSFLTAQVAQIEITRQRTYEIFPVLGDQVIKIGDADNLEEKFGKLKLFYKQVWAITGFEKYETIDVQYKDQVVATKRGAAKVYADTTKAMQQFGNTSQQIKAVLNDTTYASEVVKPLLVKDSTATKKPVTTSKQNSKQVKNNKQPKAVMKKK